jgi:hypothetical protein
VTAALAVLIGLQLLLTDSLYLFRRDFWADELHTAAIVADPDLVHSMRSLASCVDGSPPTLHLSLRAFTRLVGTSAEVSHRLFALLSVLVALVGLYACLRRCFSRMASFTAVLAIWAYPVVLHHAFEGRFYGPWLAAIVWYAYFLARSRDATSRLGSNLGVAITAVLVCTYHYLGIFSLVLVTGFELLFHRPSRATRWNGLVAAALGPVVLLACTPIYLGQKAGLTVASWAEPADSFNVPAFLAGLFTPRDQAPAVAWAVPVGVMVVAWLSAALRVVRDKSDAVAPPPRDWLSDTLRVVLARVEAVAPGARDLSALAGLTGLIALPVVLIAFSYLVQPTLEDRYGMVTVAAFAPAVAFVVAQMNRPWAVILSVFFVVVSGSTLYRECDNYRSRDEGTRGLIAALEKRTGSNPVGFESIHELFVVCRYAPREVAERCFFLDFEEHEIGYVDDSPSEIGYIDDSRVHTRDLARRFAESYGRPGLIRWSNFKYLPRRYLVADLEFYKGHYADPTLPYPGFVLHTVDDPLFELEGFSVTHADLWTAGVQHQATTPWVLAIQSALLSTGGREPSKVVSDDDE